MSTEIKEAINNLKDAFVHNTALLYENFQLKSEIGDIRERIAKLEVETKSATKSRKYTQEAAHEASAIGQQARDMANTINTRLKTIWAIIAFLFGSGVFLAMFG